MLMVHPLLTLVLDLARLTVGNYLRRHQEQGLDPLYPSAGCCHQVAWGQCLQIRQDPETFSVHAVLQWGAVWHFTPCFIRQPTQGLLSLISDLSDRSCICASLFLLYFLSSFYSKPTSKRLQYSTRCYGPEMFPIAPARILTLFVTCYLH
jgi:hypothetical protein